MFFFFFFFFVTNFVMGLLYQTLGRFNPVVVVGSILSSGDVQGPLCFWLSSFVLAVEGLLSLCDVQRAPLEFWWRAPLEVWGSALYGWGVGGFMGEVLSTYGARGSSLILVGLMLSSCEGLHSTSLRELVSI